MFFIIIIFLFFRFLLDVILEVSNLLFEFLFFIEKEMDYNDVMY